MKTLALAWTCLLLAIPCSADIVTVDPNGTGDYPTIQFAIDAASVGDTVIVAEGIYTENVSCVSQITIHFTHAATINGQVTTGTGTDIISDGDLTINSDSNITLGGTVTVAGMLGLYADGEIVINATIEALEIEMIAGNTIYLNGYIHASEIIMTTDGNIHIDGTAAVNGAVSANIYAGIDITGAGNVTGGSVAILTGSIQLIVSSTIYVDKDAPGNNDGSSWEDAFNNFYDALDAAWPGNKILVAAGTYLPDTSGLADPREASFALKNRVTVKGGYSGYGTPDPNDRDVEVYETILSGDIGVSEDPSDNCYHVFYHPEGLALDPNAILDGFTITAGNADGSGYPDYHNLGGGMYNNLYRSPTINNCIFVGN